MKAWGRPYNNSSLLPSLREGTLLCGHLHASAMHTVYRMDSNIPQIHTSRLRKVVAPYSDLNPSTEICVVVCLPGLKQSDVTFN